MESQLCSTCAGMLIWNEKEEYRVIKDALTPTTAYFQSESCRFCSILRICLMRGLTAETVYFKDWDMGFPQPDSKYSEIWVMNNNRQETKFTYGRIRASSQSIPPAPVDRSQDLIRSDGDKCTLRIAKLKRLIAHCRQNSCLSSSQSHARYQAPWPIMLVDVEEMCLVSGSTHTPFAALSYVWGGVQGLQAKVENRTTLTQSGSLSVLADEIPQLVRDAIELVRQLGERFLWTDQLCIEQDNLSMKHDQISLMDVIYHASLLTIVALDSTKASDPLPGVRSGTLAKTSPVVRIKNTYFQAHSITREPQLFRQSKYESRGWTFQERLLAPRCLYLSSTSAFYRCENGHTDEYWESSAQKPIITEDFRLGGGSKYRSDPKGMYGLYKSLAQDFSKRTLGFRCDALNAFAGVYAWLGPESLGDPACGLPLSFLNEALCWYPWRQARLVRNARFASWSWAGWTGPIDYGVVNTTSRPLNGDLSGVACTKQSIRRRLGRFDSPTIEGKAPSDVHIHLDILHCTTDCIGLDMFTFERETNLPGTTKHPLRLEMNGIICGGLAMAHDELMSAMIRLFGLGRRGQVELIRIASEGDKTIVFLVGHPKEQPTERLTIGYVNEAVWQSLRPSRKSLRLG